MSIGPIFKKKYEKLRSHFDLKDVIGFSSLIFGLLLSNASATTTNSEQTVRQNEAAQIEKQKPARKQASQSKKKIIKNTKPQQMTAKK